MLYYAANVLRAFGVMLDLAAANPLIANGFSDRGSVRPRQRASRPCGCIEQCPTCIRYEQGLMTPRATTDPYIASMLMKRGNIPGNAG